MSPLEPLVASLGGLTERTMMLLAPRLAICSWAFWLIPSPMARSQITLDTPMKIPSTVNRERSGCNRRLLTPNCQVRSQRKVMGGG